MATTPEDFETAPAAERTLAPAQIALAVGAIVLLLLLLWFFFLRPDEDAAETVTPAAPAPVVTPEEEEEEEAPSRRTPVETFEVFAPKDPFDPLISAAAAAGGGATDGTITTDGTTTTDSTTTNDGTTTADGTGTTTTTTTTGGDGGDSEDVGGHRVRVIDVFRDGGRGRAQVQVDGTVYTVDEGERFAQNFQLLSTSGQCATILFGDDEFTLCEGEEILK